jgi:integrase
MRLSKRPVDMLAGKAHTISHEARRRSNRIHSQAGKGRRQSPKEGVDRQAPKANCEEGRANALEGLEIIKRDAPVLKHRRTPNHKRTQEVRIMASPILPKKKKLPRGITRRGKSLVVSFALKDRRCLNGTCVPECECGEIERRSVGPCATPEFAVEQRALYRRQVREGTYQRWKARPEKPKRVIVGDLWPLYLRNYQNKGKSDAGRLEIAWNHLKPKFESLAIADVTTAAIEEYIQQRRADGVANATVNRETACLRAMLIRGTKVTPRMVAMVPAFPDRLPEAAPRKGFITDAEYKKLAANAKDLWLRTLIACAYSFGFRKGELLNLRVRQVDLIDRLIQLDAEDTKNGEGRKIKMTGEVFQLMAECLSGKKPEDFVFTRPAGSQVVDPREEWYSLCVSSGLGQWIPAKRKNGKEFKAYRGLNLHDFRRSAIRNMVRRGVHDSVAMKISGHKTASVFRRYNITDERDLAEATRLIEAGSQLRVSESKTDTKSDTVTYARA